MTEWTFDLPAPLEDIVIPAEDAAVPVDASDSVDDAFAPAVDTDVEDIQLELVGWFA